MELEYQVFNDIFYIGICRLASGSKCDCRVKILEFDSPVKKSVVFFFQITNPIRVSTNKKSGIVLVTT